MAVTPAGITHAESGVQPRATPPLVNRLTEVPVRAQEQEQARRPPAPTAVRTEPGSAAGAVDAGDRTRVGDQAHPLGRRTTRQNEASLLSRGLSNFLHCG